MPKQINPIRKARLKKELLEGKSAKQSMIDAGYSVNTAINATQKTVVKDCQLEIKNELTDEKIIEQLKEILRLKLSVERKLFEFVDSHPKISKKNLKPVLQAINKTKDNIAEITKTLRLVEDKPTHILQLDDNERKQRLERLGRYFSPTPIETAKLC